MATKHKHRKKGDWVAVMNGRANKVRGMREAAKCVWGCGRLIPTGGNSLLVHLVHCKGSGKKRR